MEKEYNLLDNYIDKKLSFSICLYMLHTILSELSFSVLKDKIPMCTLIYRGMYLIYFIIFITNFKYIYKRLGKKIILLISIILIVYLYNFLFYDANRPILNSKSFNLFIKMIPALITSMSILNKEVLYKYFYKLSEIKIVIFICSFIITPDALKGIDTYGYSMTWAYIMLFPTLIFIANFLKFNKFKDLIYIIICIGYIFMYGSRSPLIGILFFIFIYLLKKSFRLEKKYIIYTSIIAFISGYIILNFNRVIYIINEKLISVGVHSRTLVKLLNRTIMDNNGRSGITQNMINAITDKPITGLGIGGDRYVNYLKGYYMSNNNSETSVISGAYAHNIFYELLINFGVIIGTIIILYILYLVIRSIFTKYVFEIEVVNLSLIVVGFISLLSTSSYIEKVEFWIMIGILTNTNYKLKTIK